MSVHGRPVGRSPGVVVVLCVSLAMVRGGLAADCPESQMSFGGAGSFVTTAATFDSTTGIGPAGGGARTAFDLPGGTVEVYRCCGLGGGYTKARDAFDIVGTSPGRNVNVVAVMEVTGSIISQGCGGSGCWGFLEATISSGAQSIMTSMAENIFPPGTRPVSGEVRFPTSIVAGQPRIIEFQLSAREAPGGSHGAEGIGRIRFEGLPPGLVVVSCNGYNSAIVPVQRTTWGSLKAIYR